MLNRHNSTQKFIDSKHHIIMTLSLSLSCVLGAGLFLGGHNKRLVVRSGLPIGALGVLSCVSKGEGDLLEVGCKGGLGYVYEGSSLHEGVVQGKVGALLIGIS